MSPHNINGKIDCEAPLKLPSPDLASAAAPSAAGPASETERIIAGVLQKALRITSVGVDDNFFDLGGRSITVAEVRAKLQEALDHEISMLDLYQFTTVRALAAHLDAQSAGAQPTAAANQVSDRAARRRMARQQDTRTP